MACDRRFYAPLWYEARYPAPLPGYDFEGEDTRIPVAKEEVRQMIEASPDLAAIHPLEACAADEEVMLLEHSFYSTVPESFALPPRLRALAGNARQYTGLPLPAPRAAVPAVAEKTQGAPRRPLAAQDTAPPAPSGHPAGGFSRRHRDPDAPRSAADHPLPVQHELRAGLHGQRRGRCAGARAPLVRQVCPQPAARDRGAGAVPGPVHRCVVQRYRERPDRHYPAHL